MLEGTLTLVSILVVIGVIVFFKIREYRREARDVANGPLATGTAEPVSYMLERLGMKDLVRDAKGQVVRGGRGEVDGVMVESRRALGGNDGELVTFATTISLAPLAPAVKLERTGLMRNKDDLVLGDDEFDKRFVVTGSLAAAVLHLDLAARNALLLAARDGEWIARGDRLTHQESGLSSQLTNVLPLATRAINALRIDPDGAAKRLAQTATHDTSLRMRRRAMLRLARDHAASSSARAAFDQSTTSDAVIGLFAHLASDPPDAWSVRAREVGLAGVGVLELAEALAELERPEHLPIIGELLRSKYDDETMRALEVARTRLRALVSGGAGGLALAHDNSGGLAIAEVDSA